MTVTRDTIPHAHFMHQHTSIHNRISRLNRRKKLMSAITRRVWAMQYARDNITAKLAKGVDNYIGTDCDEPFYEGHQSLVYAIEADGIHYIVGELWERGDWSKSGRRILRKETAYDSTDHNALSFAAERMYNLLDRSIKRKMDRCARAL